MPTRVLIDTSGLLAMFDAGEEHHELANELYDSSAARLTHSYVLAEWVPLARARGVPTADVIRVSVSLLDDPEVRLVWVDAELHRAGVALLRARPDEGYSLCDAVSFVLMRREAIRDALTTDKHFEQEGFVRLLR